MARIQLRNDTAANWEIANPILLSGELGFEKDTYKYKIGDGIKNWDTLPYQNNRIKYMSVSSNTTIPTETDVVYFRMDKTGSTGQTITQNIPNSNTVIGMIIYVEFLGSSDNILRVLDNNGTVVVRLNGGEVAQLHATETGWVRFDKKTGIQGVSVTGKNATYETIKNLDFPDATITQQLEGETSISGLSDTKLANVLATDFDNKLKASAAYKLLADRNNIHPDVVKDTFEGFEYEETSAIDLTTLLGEFILLTYQITTEGTTIEQFLPPSITGKTFLIKLYRSPNLVNADLNIYPQPGELINGEDGNLEFNKTGYIGLFIPLAGGGYEFISGESLNGFHMNFGRGDGTYFSSNLLVGDGNLSINYEKSLPAAIISSNVFAPSYLAGYQNVLALDENFYLNDVFVSNLKPPTLISDRQTLLLKANTPYLCIGRLDLKDSASSNGYIKLFIGVNNTPTIDINDEITMVQKKYNSGEDFGQISIMRILKFAQDTTIDFNVEYNNSLPIQIKAKDNGFSGILVQQLDNRTSLAMLEFEQETRSNIKWAEYDMAQDINADNILRYTTTHDHTIPDNGGRRMLDGWGIDNPTPVIVYNNNRVLTIKNQSSGTAFFGFGVILDGDRSYIARGKRVQVDITLDSSSNGFYIRSATWQGKVNEFNPTVVKGDNNGIPILNDGWVLGQASFMPSGTLTGSYNFTFNSGSNLALFITPANNETVTLNIKGFNVSFEDNDKHYILKSTDLANEFIFNSSNELIISKSQSNDYDYSYYAKNPYHFLPLGEKISGNAPIEMLEAPWSGQYGYSRIPQNSNFHFLEDGIATVKTSINIKPQAFEENEITVTFGYFKLNDGATGILPEEYTLIDGTEQTLVITKGESEFEYPLFSKTFGVKLNEQVALMWKSNALNELSVLSEGGHNKMINVSCEFEKFVSQEDDISILVDLLNTRVQTLENEASTATTEIEALNKLIRSTADAITTKTYIELDNNPQGDNPQVVAKTEV